MGHGFILTRIVRTTRVATAKRTSRVLDLPVLFKIVYKNILSFREI